MKRKNLLLGLALLGLIVSPASAQILTNGSFESGLTGWSTFNASSASITPAVPYSNQNGTNVAQFPAASSAGLTQFFTLTPNTDYTFSALVAGDVVGDDSVIRFLLGDSTFGIAVIDQRQFQISATTVGTAMTGINYSFNSGIVTAAGLQIDSFSIGGTARVIYLDNVVITPVAAAPEPGTLLLLTLGSTFVVVRRKRN